MGKLTPLAVKATTAAKPIRSDVLRKMVAELTAQGCIVEINPDGGIRVTPPAAMIPRGPDPDLVDWSRK